MTTRISQEIEDLLRKYKLKSQLFDSLAKNNSNINSQIYSNPVDISTTPEKCKLVNTQKSRILYTHI